jgi:hypothetical protein
VADCPRFAARACSLMLFVLLMPGPEVSAMRCQFLPLRSRTFVRRMIAVQSAVVRQCERTIASEKTASNCLNGETSRSGDSTDRLARACSLAATMQRAFNVRREACEREADHAIALCNASHVVNSGFVTGSSVTRLTVQAICRVEDGALGAAHGRLCGQQGRRAAGFTHGIARCIDVPEYAQ